ncbi:hypothetical protein [Paenibacillus sp. MER TA 81-3]|uniref:hypothetical protein n=1 Tax=Paenibacillus sp. MER TA 81-3 TaxID=2939573 RepID=UPI0020411D44|nr:hypothetical protein [Paenibacillus sp. MER TA 81-3]
MNRGPYDQHRPIPQDVLQSLYGLNRELSLNLIPHFGDKLRDMIGEPGWDSVIQFRMGYPKMEALPSLRRPVNEVLISRM